MPLTARQLNRATLDRQLLLRRAPLGVSDGIRRIAALQAQEAASPYLALWNRLAGFDPADLDAAFATGTVVKATLMRITLHAVHAADYPAFHGAMRANLRAVRLHDRRFTSTGLTADDADALLPHLAAFTAAPRTAAEIETLLESRLGEHGRRMWWALRTFAPLRHAPTGGPWSFAGRAFVASTTPPTSEDDSLRHLALRYLEAFGPATAPDLAQFTLLGRPAVRRVLQSLTGQVVELDGPGGVTLYDLAGASLPAADTPAPPRLLPMWDSILLAYADRSRVIPPAYRPLVTRRNGDVLPTLLVDGHVAGVWRPVDDGIEATAFHPLDEETWQALATEAAALATLLAARDPATYRRYAHWWTKPLPAAQVRILRG
ncbi:winged helix DNA-binding domain-containing protein [Nonomuraea sp. NPDC003214]